MATNRPFVAADDLRLDKLTGRNRYASDMNASDLGEDVQGPLAHALILRATRVDRVFAGLNLDRLGSDLQPDVVVCAKTMASAGIRNLPGSGPAIPHLCEYDTTPAYASQPLAILIYKDFLRYRRAAQEVREDRGLTRYETAAAAAVDPKSLAARLEDWRTLIALPAESQSHYLFSRDPAAPSSHWLNGKAGWKNGFTRRGQIDPACEALYGELKALSPNDRTVETISFTQQIDPAFLEPEAGVGVRKADRLVLLTGSQSPYSDRSDIIGAMKLAGVTGVEFLTTDPGGGFGGRDKAPFSMLLALAAFFAGGPVRLAYDRFEQFHAGLKRHACGVHSLVSIDAQGALDKALVHFVLEGGVQPNLGSAVLGLAALHGTGFYRFRKAGSHGVLTQRPVPIVGSMRGFGIPQVLFNLEMAVDKLAVLKLGQDPIAFRRANVLRHDPDSAKADPDLAGTPMRFHVANAEVCDLAAAHPLWVNRQARRNEAASRGVYAGVGFAGCMQAYGTTEDSIYAAIQLEESGEFVVWSQSVDMGQGARRSLAQIAESLLRAPVRMALGDISPFDAFREQVKAFFAQYPLPPAYDDGEKDRLVGHASSSASKTAFFHAHGVAQAARALLRLKIFPAVRALTGTTPSDDALDAALHDGAFHLSGRPPLRLEAVAKHMVSQDADRFAIVHAFFGNGWSSAVFDAGAGEPFAAVIDALGFAIDGDAPARLAPLKEPIKLPERWGPGKDKAPRSGYAAGAHLIAVEIDPRRRSLRVTDAAAFVDAGDPIIESVLMGQIEGGFQMGLAQTLLEALPPGAGEDRFVNFDRYIVPRASDLTTINLDQVLVPLPATGALNGEPNIRHKGVGEVTMTTVAPAIANAIAHALGHANEAAWPTQLPIRFGDLKFSGKPGA